MGNNESVSRPNSESSNQNMESFLPKTTLSDNRNSILQDQIQVNQRLNELFDSQLNKLSTNGLTDHLDLDPSTVLILQHLINEIRVLELKLEQLEQSDVKITPNEIKKFDEYQRVQVNRVKKLNDAYKDATDSMQEQQLLHQKLVHERAVLSSKNKCLTKILNMYMLKEAV